MKYNELIEKELESFNQHMYEQLTPQKNRVEEAMIYSLNSGGKRIRPMLMLAGLQALGHKTRTAYDAAAALEMIHTYSLIHDDLPSMDNDELRRGQPTNHIVYGEAIALLAGDGLLTLSFEVINNSKDLSDAKKVNLTKVLAQAAGSRGMIDGQMRDIQSEQQKISLAELELLHLNKTGALLYFSLYAAAVIAEEDSKLQEAYEKMAQHIGLAFQIRDDILDVVGDVDDLGKQPGQDEKLEKSTYPSLLGLSGAYEALEDELNQTMEENRALKEDRGDAYDNEVLDSFIDYLRLERQDGKKEG